MACRMTLSGKLVRSEEPEAETDRSPESLKGGCRHSLATKETIDTTLERGEMASDERRPPVLRRIVCC